ncbi:unnamed protein product [Rhizophagus irregularis]|nr:unnamed protein product [Rhizophagus irregularis]
MQCWPELYDRRKNFLFWNTCETKISNFCGRKISFLEICVTSRDNWPMRLFGIWDGIWDLEYGWDLGWDFGKWDGIWDGWDGIGDSPIPFNMGGKYRYGDSPFYIDSI